VTAPALRRLGEARPSLRADVSQVLRAAVVTGELLPGRIYSVPKLAQQFGVSATPVREAMLELVQEGLLTPAPNKGFRIVEMSDDDLDEIAAVRLLLEPPATGEVARRGDREAVRLLRPVADSIVTSARAGDLAGYLSADLDFHLGLLALLGNRRLVDTVRGLRTQTRLYGLTRLAETDRLRGSAMEHLELLTLVEAGDDAGAEALLRRHIGHTRGIWSRPRESRPA